MDVHPVSNEFLNYCWIPFSVSWIFLKYIFKKLFLVMCMLWGRHIEVLGKWILWNWFCMWLWASLCAGSWVLILWKNKFAVITTKPSPQPLKHFKWGKRWMVSFSFLIFQSVLVTIINSHLSNLFLLSMNFPFKIFKLKITALENCSKCLDLGLC